MQSSSYVLRCSWLFSGSAVQGFWLFKHLAFSVLTTQSRGPPCVHCIQTTRPARRSLILVVRPVKQRALQRPTFSPRYAHCSFLHLRSFSFRLNDKSKNPKSKIVTFSSKYRELMSNLAPVLRGRERGAFWCLSSLWCVTKPIQPFVS